MSAHLPGTKNSGSKTLKLFPVESTRGQYQWSHLANDALPALFGICVGQDAIVRQFDAKSCVRQI
jgi:hypothetical protein